jgi:hypothetical protein
VSFLSTNSSSSPKNAGPATWEERCMRQDASHVTNDVYFVPECVIFYYIWIFKWKLTKKFDGFL